MHTHKYVFVCVCVYTYIQTLCPSACPFPIQPPASPKMISMWTSGVYLFAKHMFFLSTHGPSNCPNYFWHHQESSWPIMTTLWPVPLFPLSEYFTSKFLFLLMHRGKRKMHEVLTYMQSDPLSPALITSVCTLPALFTANSMWAVAKSYAAECSALGTLGADTEASGLQFLQKHNTKWYIISIKLTLQDL